MSNQVIKLQAGAQGNSLIYSNNNTPWESQKRINLFKVKDLYPVMLSANRPYSCTILPAFDPELDARDQARSRSVAPYRDKMNLDPDKGFPQFTGWFVPFVGYAYYGAGMSTFLSPKTLGQPDPIQDIRKYVQDREKMGDTTLHNLIESDRATKTRPPACRTQRMTMFNIWGGTTNVKAKDQSIKNRVLVLKEQASRKLFADLDELCPRSMDPVDPNWSDFLYGDPTRPEAAIEMSVFQYQPDGNGFPGPALNLGERKMVGGKMVANIVTHQLNDVMLAGRYDLQDIENVVHVPTYDEIVELLVAEELIPYSVISAACADKCESFPQKKATHSTPAPAPKPVTAAPIAARSAFDDDEIPGLKTVQEEAPVAARTPEPAPAPAAALKEEWSSDDEKRLNELKDKISKNDPSLEMSDYDELTQLMRKRAKVTGA